MTIEKLEALERAATAGPWAYEPIYWAFRMAEKADDTHVPDDLAKDAVYPNRDDAVFMAESRTLIGPLLAVAKAAKARLDAWDAAVADPNAACYQCEDDEQIKRERAALAQLEAKP